MFKRILATCLMVGALVAGVNQSAFASRARELALGTNDPYGTLQRGSFFYEDNENIFYNPSYINDFKNWATIEKNNAATTAEAGFVTAVQNFNLGLYFNRGDALSQTPVVGTSGTAVSSYTGTLPGNLRPVDVMFGGDMGVKWGLGLTYAQAERPGSLNSTQALVVRAGVQVNDFEPFINWQAVGKDQNTAGINKPTLFDAGLRYHWGEWVPFVMFRMDNANVAGNDNKMNTIGVGLGRSAKVGDATHLYYSVSYWNQNHINPFIVPIDMSVESELASWLVARAGFTYNLWFNQYQSAGTGTDTTSARLGATFKYNKVDFDWVVGGNASALGGASYGSTTSQSFDVANGFFSQASLTYAW